VFFGLLCEKDRFGQNTEIHRDIRRFLRCVDQGLMVRQQRQFGVTKVADFEVLCDDHFSFGRERSRLKRDQRG